MSRKFIALPVKFSGAKVLLAMSKQKPEIPRSRLRERTVELLRNRPRSVTLKQIEVDTNLPVEWLLSIMSKGSSPSVDRIVLLYEYLTDSRLHIT